MNQQEEIELKNKLQTLMLATKSMQDQLDQLKGDCLIADRLGVSNPTIETKRIGIAYLEFCLGELAKKPEEFLVKGNDTTSN